MKRVSVTVSGGFHNVPERTFMVPEDGVCSRDQSNDIHNHICPSFRGSGCMFGSRRSCRWVMNGKDIIPPYWRTFPGSEYKVGLVFEFDYAGEG
jgi:hypothetical protein